MRNELIKFAEQLRYFTGGRPAFLQLEYRDYTALCNELLPGEKDPNIKPGMPTMILIADYLVVQPKSE